MFKMSAFPRLLAAAVFLTTAATAATSLGQSPPAQPAPAQPAAKKFVEITPQEPAADWLIDEPTGRVFAAIGTLSRVVEYDPTTGKPIREIPIPEAPRLLFAKGGKLAVATDGGPSVFVVDLKTNQVEGKVPLAGAAPTTLFGSKAANPYVYAICRAPNSSGGGDLYQVDLSARRVRKTSPISTWRQSSAAHAAMAPDGRTMVVDARASSSPSGATLMRVDEEKLEFADLVHLHESFPPMSVDPAGRFWTFGTALHNMQDLKKVRQLRGVGELAIHPTYDLALAVGGDAEPKRFWERLPISSLLLQTFSTAETLAEVWVVEPPPALPAGQTKPKTTRRPTPVPASTVFADDPALGFDLAHDRAFVGYRSTAWVVDLKTAGIKPKAALTLNVASAYDAAVGQPITVPLALTDPKLMAGTKLSLESAPKGATIAANQLTWTPGTDDVGDQKVVVRAERDGSSDTATFTLRVTRPSVELGGLVRDMVVDPAGGRALALVNPPISPQQARNRFNDGRQPAELVLVDLKTLRVLARRSTDEPITAIGLTATAAFVVPQNVARIQKLKLTDLSDDGRTFTTGIVQRLELLPWGDLVVYGQQGVQRYDGQTLSPAPWAPSNNGGVYYDPYGQQQSISRTNGGTLVGPTVIDAKTNAVRMLTAAPGLPAVVSDARMSFGEQVGVLGPWGRRVNGNQLVGPGNAVIGQLGQNGGMFPGASLILESVPAVATVVTTVDGRDPPVRTVRVELRDLTAGGPLDPLTLSRSAVALNKGYNGFDQSPAKLFERASRLVVGADDRLYALDLPADKLKAVAAPLYFVQKLEPLSAPVKGVLTIQPEVAGGHGPRSFELPGSPDGTSIDPKTGAVSVDTAKVWQKHLEQVGQQQGVYGGGYPMAYAATRPAGPVEQAQAAYKALTGKDAPADAYPLAVHLRAVAKDQENQRAELSGYVVLLGPAKDVTAVIQRRAAATQAALQQAEAANRRMQAEYARQTYGGPATRPAADGGADVATLQRRIAELERRNQQLEGQIELMKDLVRGGAANRGPATGPAR
jgi:hypothetical protein